MGWKGGFMAKSVKAYTILADKEKVVWVEGELTKAFTDKLLRLYKRVGIDLNSYGSVSQLLQLNQLSDIK
jgi:hypothetical protein